MHIHTHTHTHKSTSTGNRMFQWLQKLVPLKHLSSEHMIYKCTQIQDRNEELKDTFIANDFPINIVDRIFQKYIPHKYRTDGRENTQKTPIDFENLSKFRM